MHISFRDQKLPGRVGCESHVAEDWAEISARPVHVALQRNLEIVHECRIVLRNSWQKLRPLRFAILSKGVWHPDAEYEEGDAATDRGSLWLCVRRLRGCRPASDANYWTMAVKNGAAR